MYKNLRVSLVISCYNEEKGLMTLIAKVPDIVDKIVVVDGGSTELIDFMFERGVTFVSAAVFLLSIPKACLIAIS